jgi:hypothetical protein
LEQITILSVSSKVEMDTSNLLHPHQGVQQLSLDFEESSPSIIPEATVARKHECTYCYESFPTARGLVHHMSRSHPELTHSASHDPSKVRKILGCAMCSKTFLSVRGLEYHMDIHIDAKTHLCKKCGQGFNLPGALWYQSKACEGVPKPERYSAIQREGQSVNEEQIKPGGNQEKERSLFILAKKGYGLMPHAPKPK